MILQALCNYYKRLADDTNSHVALQGYARTGISACIVIDHNGDVKSVRSLLSTNENGKAQRTSFVVPEQPKRSGPKPAPAFLCENAEFIFGIYKDEKGSEYRFEASKDLHKTILGDIDDPGAIAVLNFFEKRTKGRYDVYNIDTSPFDSGGNIIFQLQGDMCYLHERPAIRAAWEKYREGLSNEASVGQCLITGEIAPIARLHASISGFGQDKPTLVAFKQPSFNSYGKIQGLNAPVSEKAAFEYTTALDMLMSDKMHRLYMNNEYLLFWAERVAPLEESLLTMLFSPDISQENFIETPLDESYSTKLRGVISAMYRGSSIYELQYDKDIRFYILGITRNKTRLVIRFFHTDSFGNIADRVSKHLNDISITGGKETGINKLLAETALKRELDKVPPILASQLLQSILKGTAYPYSIYLSIINRIKAEGGNDPSKNKGHPINHIRVGFIKGFLNRTNRINNKKEMMTVALNKEERDTSYILGRLFALLEKAQKDALGNVNASIVDKYLNSALATPQMVFPMLLALSKKHISKSEKRYIEQYISDVMSFIPSSGFPLTLNTEQQGRFIVGYYHQNQDLYTKKTDNNEMEVEKNV